MLFKKDYIWNENGNQVKCMEAVGVLWYNAGRD